MNLTLELYVSALHDTLRGEVLPYVTDEHPRSQLLGAIDILEKLRGLSDWSPEMIGEQSKALSEGLSDLGVSPGADQGKTSSDDDAFRAEILKLYHDQDGPHSAHPGDREATIIKSLRAYLSAERKRIAAANFSAMT